MALSNLSWKIVHFPNFWARELVRCCRSTNCSRVLPTYLSNRKIDSKAKKKKKEEEEGVNGNEHIETEPCCFCTGMTEKGKIKQLY